MQTHSLHRRTFLRGLGGAVLGLPWLQAMGASTKDSPPMRMVCVGTHFGFVPSMFFPKEVGSDYRAPELIQQIERHRSKLTLFSHLDHGAEGVGGHGGVHAFLSGILSKNARGFAEKNISVDQKAADHVRHQTRYPSLQLCSGKDGGSALSWNRAGVALPAIHQLSRLHRMLFASADAREGSVWRETLESKRSVLDLVREDAGRLQRRLGREDQQTLEEYFTSVRALERRLEQSIQWMDRPKPPPERPLPKGVDELDFIERVPLFYEMMGLALKTDATRVITLGLTDLGPNLGGFQITRDYHQLTHHGKVPSYLEELSVIERFHFQAFGRFLDQLEGEVQSDGRTLLDHSMVLLGSGMGNASSHSNKNLPLLLAGGGFRHGQHLQFRQGLTPASNLFVSMLQRFGVETDRFNLSTGSLSGLDVA